MNPRGISRHCLLALGLALVAYGVCFRLIQHRRVANGPWEVTFTSEATVPLLVVNQARLGIAGVRVVFGDRELATNVLQTIRFAETRSVPFDLPFGKCVFLDPLFLPGTVVIESFGQQIQLMPRALTIDKIEHPWRSGETIVLPPATNAALQRP